MRNEFEANLKQIYDWRANLSRQIIYETIKIGQFDGINKSKMTEQ